MTAIRRVMRRSASRPRHLLGLAIIVLAVAACGASAASFAPSPTESGAPGASLPGQLTPGPVDLTPVPGGASSGPGGSAPGGGTVPPGDGTNPGGGTGPGNPSQPTIVTPVAGLLNILAVPAADLGARVVGRRVTVTVAWWSGVEPCSVLSGVDVARDGSTITLTVREGAAQLSVACDMIAKYKATIVDLGELNPGTWTIKAFGDPPAITVDVTS